MDKFEDEFATWPTDPEPQLDRREILEDRFRDQFSDFDDVEPKEGEDLKESEDSLKGIEKRLRETSMPVIILGAHMMVCLKQMYLQK